MSSRSPAPARPAVRSRAASAGLEVCCIQCRRTAELGPAGELPGHWERHTGFRFDDPHRRTFPIYACSWRCAQTAATDTQRRLRREALGGAADSSRPRA